MNECKSQSRFSRRLTSAWRSFHHWPCSEPVASGSQTPHPTPWMPRRFGPGVDDGVEGYSVNGDCIGRFGFDKVDVCFGLEFGPYEVGLGLVD